MNEFGKYLSKLRKQAGYKSQRKLAIASGVSNGSISRIEAGIQQPDPETLRLLSIALGVPHEELKS